MALGPPPEIILFAAFELDTRSRELRKNGVRIKLPEQPIKVLTVLLRHAGKVVTREELRAEVWPADTFIDFDSGLNTAINKLRDALGDSSDKPRFIETLPRRGYRFIPAVVGNEQEASPTEATRDIRRSLWKVLVPGFLVVIVGLMALVWNTHEVPHLAGKDTVILGDFTNLTGDSVFDGTLRQGLSVQLQQSPFLKLASEEQVRQTLRMMGLRADVPLSPEIAREVCQRTNSSAALNGQIALVGTRYDLIIRAVDCATGDVLVSAEAQAIDKTSVLDALGKMVSEVRGKLGESLGTIRKYSTPLAQATTPSLEALQFYSLGNQTQTQTGDLLTSLAFFQKAIERDPNFAMAYWGIGDVYSNTGEGTAAAEYEKKAFGLRAGVSEWEKMIIEADYSYYVTGNLFNAQRGLDLMVKTYPRNEYPHDILAYIFNIFGRYDNGLNQCLEVIQLAPSNSRARRHVVLTYLLLNRVEEALVSAQQAQVNGLDSDLAPVLYSIAFHRGDTVEMARQIASAARRPGREHLPWALEADTAAYFGHLGKAREFSRHAVESAERVSEKETAAGYSAVSALREALFGNSFRARQQAAIAIQRATGRDSEYGVALALAYAGDVNGAQRLADDLERRFPEDTVMRINYLPTLRAKLAISHSNPQRALEVLGTAAPYELGLPSYSDYNWPNLYPVYVRGEAFLAAHQGRDAAAEFRKIVDHRNIVLNEPIGALAHLQLGRAYAMSGEGAKARTAYQDFLGLWKNADSGIPILNQAKGEYAKLK